MGSRRSQQSRSFTDEASWLALAPLPTALIRERRLVYVNESLARLFGGSREEVEGLEFPAFLAPEERPRVMERHRQRLAGEVVPTAYEATIVGLEGTRRRVELFVGAVSDDGALVVQVADRTNRGARNDKLGELAKLGAAVQSYHDERSLLAAVGDGLTALGAAWARLAPDGDGMRIVDIGGPTPVLDAFRGAVGNDGVGALGQWSPAMLEAWQQGAAFMDDMPLSSARFFANAASRSISEAIRSVGLFRGVSLRIGMGGVAAELLAVLAPWLDADDLPAFKLFATQVSAALDAAGVISDLSARNAELAALNRVAVAAGGARDLESLFAVLGDELSVAIGSSRVLVHLLDASSERATLAFSHGISPEAHAAATATDLPEHARRLVESIRAAKPKITLAEELPAEARKWLDAAGLRSVTAVPLVARSSSIGQLTAAYAHVATERELRICEAAAAHFAASLQAKRLFESLRSSYAKLEHTQAKLVHQERLAAIGELAAVVAHEVRNPLGVIFNSIGAVRRMVGDAPEARTIVRILDEEAHRLNHIVGDLLDFARPAPPSLHAERLESVLDAATEAGVGAARTDVVVIRRYAADLPLVMIDARLVRQAFLNLVMNAVQAMPRGGTLTVAIEAKDAGLAVSISDTGDGISDELRSRVFEPFFTTRATGTGLGLAVVKRIIDSHRGTVSIESRADGGTTFVVYLPTDPDEAPQVDSARFG